MSSASLSGHKDHLRPTAFSRFVPVHRGDLEGQ
jgi:hypothetical protein